MSTSILKGSLLVSKYPAQWWLDKLALLVIGTVAYGMAVAHPFFNEDWNVFTAGSGNFSAVIVSSRGVGRLVGNFLTIALIGNPFGLVQLGTLVGVTCLVVFIWQVLRAETLWVRAILSSLFVLGFPYFVHGISFQSIGNNHGVSTLIFIWLLRMIGRGYEHARWINHVSVGFLVAILALAYEPWMLFLFGMTLMALAVKFSPGLFGRLHVYKMSNSQILSLLIPISFCLLLRAFSLEGQIKPSKTITGTALFELTVITLRICLNIFVDSLPIGAIVGFGIMRSSKRFTFSRLGLWPHLLFGSTVAAIGLNFSYGLLLNGGVMDWRVRYVIILVLTAVYYSLPWGTIGVWVQKHTGIMADRRIGFAVALLSLKLVYTIWFTFIVSPVDRWGWLQYRSRILARDPSVMQDFTDFGQCDNKYCYSFSGLGFAHVYIAQYWEGGAAARLLSWLPIEGFY